MENGVHQAAAVLAHIILLLFAAMFGDVTSVQWDCINELTSGCEYL